MPQLFESNIVLPEGVIGAAQPILLKGLVEDWPAVQACRGSYQDAVAYLNQFAKEDPVTVYIGQPEIEGRFFYNDEFTGFNFRSGKASLQQVFEKIGEQLQLDDKLSIYVGSTPVDGWLPDFRRANDLNLPVADALPSFWLGTPTKVSAHFDFPDNIACVVAGRRRFTLFPPEQIDNLYVGPIDLTPSGQAISLVDIDDPDLQRYPKFAKAQECAQIFELDPGDALYIPSMWWHHVVSLEPFNLLVNYWWCTTMAALGSPSNAMMHAILALRDLPERQKQVWQNLFNHYVFENSESVFAHIPETGRGCLETMDEKMALRLKAEIQRKLSL